MSSLTRSARLTFSPQVSRARSRCQALCRRSNWAGSVIKKFLPETLPAFGQAVPGTNPGDIVRGHGFIFQQGQDAGLVLGPPHADRDGGEIIRTHYPQREAVEISGFSVIRKIREADCQEPKDPAGEGWMLTESM